jgi:hypothetical protein
VWERPDDPDKVVKQWYNVYEKPSAPRKILNIDNNFINNRRSLFDYWRWCVSMIPQWQNIILQNKLIEKSPHFPGIPKIYNINEKLLSWEQEKGYEVQDISVVEQLDDINKTFEKYNINIADAHCDNIMMNKHKKLIFVDGEILKKNTMVDILYKLYFRMRGLKCIPTYKYNNILWNNDGRQTPILKSRNHKHKIKEGKYDHLIIN